MSKRCKSSRIDLLSGAGVDVSQKAANAIKYAFSAAKTADARHEFTACSMSLGGDCTQRARVNSNDQSTTMLTF
jgi:hypothetical protein